MEVSLMTTKKAKEKRLQVNVELQGEQVDRFLRFKEADMLPTNSAAGRKLIIERLNEREKQQTQPATA
jgi:hypothetical protein